MAVAGFATYLELASYFPNRSGSEAVYLEQAYPRPKHLFPIAFAVQSVIVSFSSSNAIGKWSAGLSPFFVADSLAVDSALAVSVEDRWTDTD